MSTRELPQERTWVACVGDFAILKEYLAQKKQPVWRIVQFLHTFLCGFGQIVFSNNPISGLLLIITLAVVTPGTLALSASTAGLGLLLSVVCFNINYKPLGVKHRPFLPEKIIQEPQVIVENGLSVFNPLLVGAVSYSLIPQIYGAFDIFSVPLVLLAAVLSVYLARSLRSDKFSCTAWPFNLVEYMLIFVLLGQNRANVLTESAKQMFERHNATSETMTTTMTTMSDAGFYKRNASDVYINWGKVFRGSVVSASQLFFIDDVIVGCVMYLAMIIYSPVTTAFSFFGALCGTVTGLELGADYGEVYSGLWGYNSLLTGAALGGNLLILNGQTAIATVLAIIYTSLLQYSLRSIFMKQLPVLTLPFVIAISLFLKLSGGKNDPTFPWPVSITFPEKARHDYLARRTVFRADNTPEELELVIQKPKDSTQDS
ncbi:urea transporter 1-like isoform X2 [Pseudomyrmex gracilis]|uniref:urea transporter 1-like isoform X2 n=1 Tax=Pseudomyrmex gracilis TaxID=219809 RepID=UPI000995A6B0|nr:urea transporter 1-like isoform X2 [Pseudomyrmex gracilis]